MADSRKHEFEFFLMRYVPDAVKNEFVNIGVVLVGADGGYADVRFTRDWRRVLCLDPGVDLEWLQAMERDVRMRLQDPSSRADILYRLQDLCSNTVQVTASQGCLTLNPAEELESLAKTYLLPAPLRAGKRAPSARQRILTVMRDAFEGEGVWKMMFKEIPAAKYTHAGDPLKIDCAYNAGDGVLKMFQAVSLSSDVDAAKVLAFSYPEMAAGLARGEKVEASLTAVVEDSLDRSDEAILFALAMMERSRIAVASVGEMPKLAEAARMELLG